MSADVEYRRVEGDEYRGFIMRSWLYSYKYSDWAGCLPMNLYYKTYDEGITQLLAREGVEVWVALDPKDAIEPVRGFAVVERGFRRPVVHYVYVKQFARTFGIGTELLRRAGIDPYRVYFDYTYRTDDSDSLIDAKQLRARHVPKYARLLKRDQSRKRSPR